MRLKIYQALLERKHCVRSLAKKFGISESAISQHMKVMKDAGLVYGEKYGYHTHYLPLQDAVDYLTVGSFTSTWVTAPTNFPSCIIGLPLTSVCHKGQQFYSLFISFCKFLKNCPACAPSICV